LRGVRSGTTRQTGFQEGAFLKTAEGGASIRTTGSQGSALRALVSGETEGLHSRGVDCAIQTNYWTQVHMVSNPCCCPFKRSGCGKRGAFSSRRPTAWKPGGRSQRDRLPVDPKGGAAVPRSGIHQAIHGVSMPEQPDRVLGNQVEFRAVRCTGILEAWNCFPGFTQHASARPRTPAFMRVHL
jgi:hypothetical protein